MTNDKQKLIRQYAAGEISWHTLRDRGFENYLDVLGGLGDLGLRPPVAPMEGRTRRPAAAGARFCAKRSETRSRDATPWPHRYRCVAAHHLGYRTGGARNIARAIDAPRRAKGRTGAFEQLINPTRGLGAMPYNPTGQHMEICTYL